MSLRRSFELALCILIIAGCAPRAAVVRARDDCTLQVAYVEAGDTPSVYWMRICGESLELQPLGHGAIARKADQRRLAAIVAELRSPQFMEAMEALVRLHPQHYVEPHHAFFDIRYGGYEVHVPPEELPETIRAVFLKLDQMFELQYGSAYGAFLRHK